jgi:hypothetical protein
MISASPLVVTLNGAVEIESRAASGADTGRGNLPGHRRHDPTSPTGGATSHLEDLLYT